MCNDKTQRSVIKRGAGVPTVPPSANHRNGDWIETDIYEGEIYQDTSTGLVYTRNAAGITAIDGGAAHDVYKAVVSQTGGGDPVIEQVIQNTLALTVTPSYVVTGSYQLGGMAGNAARVVEITMSGLGGDQTFAARPTSANVISLSTFSFGSPTDGVLTYQGVTYPRNFCILTIKFF